MLLKLSVVIAGAALMNSLTTATNADAQNTSNTPEVPQRATIVGQEMVYPNGVMVSLDKGTGLPSPTINPRTGQLSQEIDPNSVPRATVITCSAGYTCLYESANYGGRRLQWRDRGQLINLSAYGFDNQMTSWRNLNSVDARWYYSAGGGGTSLCMNANTSVTNVGSTHNNKASSLRIYTNSTTCN